MKRRVFERPSGAPVICEGEIRVGDLAYSPETDEFIIVSAISDDFLWDNQNNLHYNDNDPLQYYRVVKEGLSEEQFVVQTKQMMRFMDTFGDIDRMVREAHRKGAVNPDKLDLSDNTPNRVLFHYILKQLSDKLKPETKREKYLLKRIKKHMEQ